MTSNSSAQAGRGFAQTGDGPGPPPVLLAGLGEQRVDQPHRGGAVPQVVSHDGRGPHIHVSRPAAPMADRITAHLAMGLAGLLVSGESARLRSCASPTCRDVFLDESRNRSRRYCDSRSCGNRLHVAAYRARKAAAG